MPQTLNGASPKVVNKLAWKLGTEYLVAGQIEKIYIALDIIHIKIKDKDI